MAILPFPDRTEEKLRDAVAQYVLEMEYSNCVESDSAVDPKSLSEFAFSIADAFLAARKKRNLPFVHPLPTLSAALKSIAADEQHIPSERWVEYGAYPERFAVTDDGEPKLNAAGDPKYKTGRKPNKTHKPYSV